MTRLGPLLVLVVVVATDLPVAAQQRALAFEVVSVKPVAAPVGPFLPGSRPACPISGCGGPGTGSPERITFAHTSVRDLIRVAYNMWSPNQIEGPAWMASATFDVVANIPAGATRDQVNGMLQNLLADRFQLKVHRSTRELPIYALVVAKNGPKLKVAANDPNAPKARGMSWSRGRKRLEFDGRTMADFASTLESDVRRTVIDKTGLEGTYDIRLEFAEDNSGPLFGSPDPQVPDLFTALTEQLGLRLESGTGPVEVLVIDSVERATSD